jgi:hypothetical protein
MGRMLMLSAAAVLCGGSALASPRGDLEALEKFVTNYHRKPAPKDVPAMFRGLLKGRLVERYTEDDPPHSLVLLAHAFGHMARGNAALVRACESEFAGASHAGRLFVLSCLRVCGDRETRTQVAAWEQDRQYAKLRKGLDEVRKSLADPDRKLPRDRPARTPSELDLLWADFLVTGEYAAVARILDVFDQEDLLRARIASRLKGGGAKRAQLLKALKDLALLQPGTADKMVEGDLALALLHDAAGRITQNPARAIRELQPFLGLSEGEWVRVFLLKSSASWSVQSNLRQHPRLRELFSKHGGQRPRQSRQLLKLWLADGGSAK